MSRLSKYPDTPERDAAWAIYDLALAIQGLCYYADPRTIPPATTRALHKCYRVLKPTTVYYMESEHGLLWDAPSWKFQPKAK